MSWLSEWLHICRVVARLAPGCLLFIVGGLVLVGISESFSPPWDRHTLVGGALVAGLAFLGLMKRLLVSQFTLNAEAASHSSFRSPHDDAPDRHRASQIQETDKAQQASESLNQQPKSRSVPRRKQSALKADVRQLREEIEELKGLLHATILRINSTQPEQEGGSHPHVEGASGGESREARDEIVASIERKLEMPDDDDDLERHDYIRSINDTYGGDLFSADSGIPLDSPESGISLIPADADPDSVPDDHDFDLFAEDSGLILAPADSDIIVISDDSDISVGSTDSGLSLDPADSGLRLAPEASDINLD